MNAQAGFRSRNCKPIRKQSKKRNTRKQLRDVDVDDNFVDSD